MRNEGALLQVPTLLCPSHSEEFDFSFQPKINEKLIRELAIALGLKAGQANKRVLFYTAEQITGQLAAAEVSGRLIQLLDQLARTDLLIIDELGYLSLTKQRAKRYEKGSIIITLSKTFCHP